MICMHGMAILSSLDYVPTVRPAGLVIHTSEAIITASVNVALYIRLIASYIATCTRQLMIDAEVSALRVDHN